MGTRQGSRPCCDGLGTRLGIILQWVSEDGDVLSLFSARSPVAVALFDYEALGEESEDGNLAFTEGDIIEVRLQAGLL